MKAYLAMVRSGLRSFVRDRGGLFWSFFFPMFFIFIFGSIMGRPEDELKVPIRIVMQDSSPIVSWLPGVFEKNPTLQVKVTDLAGAKRDISQSKARAVVIFPEGSATSLENHTPIKVTVLADQTSPQMSGMAVGMIRSMLDSIEKSANKTPQMFAVGMGILSPSEVGKKPASGIDALLPGILAMTIMQLGLFSALPFIVMREKGILKRLRATPLPRATIIGAQVTQRVCIAFLQTAMILIFGTLFFHFHMQGSWLALAGLVVFGVLTFICIGAVLSSIAKTQETGVSMVQLINFPMMFLSGFFFPVEMLPGFMQPIVKIIPATYLADMLRAVMVGSPLKHSLAMELGMLGAWLLGGFFVAVKKFRWE